MRISNPFRPYRDLKLSLRPGAMQKKPACLSIFILMAAVAVFSTPDAHAQAQPYSCPALNANGVFDKNSDLVITTYHSHIAGGPNLPITWGEDMDSTGNDQLTLQEISVANGYNYTGDVVMFAVSGNDGAQGFLLTTTGLYAWGPTFEVINGTIASSQSFASMTMPPGVTPADVLDIKANSDVFFLVTKSGNVWVAGRIVDQVSGTASDAANTWHRVETAPGVPLTGVVELTGSREAVYVRRADGSLLAWGRGIGLGGGAAAVNLTYATAMNLSAIPAGVTLSQIGTYYDNVANSSGVLALGSNGRVYGVGESSDGRLINNSSGYVNQWTVLRDSSGNPIENIVFLSTSENSEEYASAAIIVDNPASATNTLLTWGEADARNIGHAPGIIEYPTVPSGYTVGVSDAVYTSVGGHATSYFDRTNKICFVGHISNGSGGMLQSNPGQFQCFDKTTDPDWPASVDLCSLPPVATDDADLSNAPGTSVTIDILANDMLGLGATPGPSDVTVALDESSVPGGVLNVDGSVTVPGEGVWSYNAATGELTFSPCTAPGVPDASCQGALLVDPSPIDYTITEIATGVASAPATVTVTYIPTTISGTLVNDLDGNGSQDASDDVLAGVTVSLLDAGGNPVLDASGNAVSAVTDANGNYSFTGNFPAGNYQISVDPNTLPGGDPSNIDDPTPTFDPDGTVTPNLATISLTPGTDVTGQNFGYTGDSLPVMLSHVSSQRYGDRLRVDWSTSSELFNVGFQLWALDGSDNRWKKLHNWLVKSASGNAVEPQSYTKTVRVPRSVDKLVALGISSVDSDGSENYYGPFQIGRSYGKLSDLAPIAWDHIRRQLDQTMTARGYVKDRVNGYRKVSSPVAGGAAELTEQVAELTISQSGIYRITASELKAAGLDVGAVPKKAIAVLDHRGHPVVRYVLAKGAGSGHNRALGANGSIYFYGDSPKGKDALYSEVSHYRIVVDPNRALTAPVQGKRGVGGEFSDLYRERQVIELDNHYVLNAQGDDPWIERTMISEPGVEPVASNMLNLPSGVDQSAGVKLIIGVGRASGLTPVDADADGVQDPEHVITGAVLDAQGKVVWLPAVSETGKGSWEAVFTVPVALGDVDGSTAGLQALVGASFSAGRGYRFSEIQLDYMGLEYARSYVAKTGESYLQFTAPNAGESGYQVTIPDQGYALAFAYNKQGALVRLIPESQERQSVNGENQRLITVAALNGAGLSPAYQSISYWVSGQRGFLSAESVSMKLIALASELLARASGMNYLMIAHPAFIDHNLNQYAAHQRLLGHRVAVVNYLDVVEIFGGGQAGPGGLSRYLSAVNNAYDQLEHVLLVGGSVYDHTDKLGTGAVTFLPGHYGESAYSKFTISDVPFITAADGSLFSSVGRWPVRTPDDLQMIVAKSISWSNADHSQASALLVAEHTLAGEAINFGQALDTLAPLLPANWTQRRVYVDDIVTANPHYSLPQALGAARSEIIEALNRVPRVVLYNGHATVSQLSNKGLFRAADVQQVSASGAEIWVPMSCYLTFYESTHVNTLAHQLLFSGNAVGITGAMLLSGQAGNISAGQAILEGMVKRGETLGASVNAHKTAQGSERLNINWALLGDASLQLNR